MCAADGFFAGQVGDGACNAQDPMHRARAELQLVDRAFQQRLVAFGQAAMDAGLCGVHLRIRFARARMLHATGSLDARTNVGARLATGRVRTPLGRRQPRRSEEPTSELQSLMRSSYAVICLTKNRRAT